MPSPSAKKWKPGCISKPHRWMPLNLIHGTFNTSVPVSSNSMENNTNLYLCSIREIKSNRFGTTFGWENDIEWSFLKELLQAIKRIIKPEKVNIVKGEKWDEIICWHLLRARLWGDILCLWKLLDYERGLSMYYCESSMRKFSHITFSPKHYK